MNPGEELLAAVTDGIVEDEWAVRSPGALRWWPHDLAQTVRAPPLAPDVACGMIRIETEIARDVPVRTQRVAGLLREMNTHSPLSVVTASNDGVVRLALTARLPVGSPEVGWLRALVACQASDAAEWSGMAEVLGGRRATSHHPDGPRESPGVVLGAAREVEDRSWARGPAVDPSWVEAGLGPEGGTPAWVGPGRDVVAAPWVVPDDAGTRWEGRDDLATSAWIELDPTYGPAVTVRTVVPWAVPPALSHALVRGLNADGRLRVRDGLRGSWQALADRPSVAVRHVVPLGSSTPASPRTRRWSPTWCAGCTPPRSSRRGTWPRWWTGSCRAWWAPTRGSPTRVSARRTPVARSAPPGSAGRAARPR